MFSKILTIPDDGSKFEVEAEGLRTQVDQLADRRVEWAYVSKILPEEREDENREDGENENREKNR